MPCKIRSIARLAIAVGVVASSSTLVAQNSIQLFGPADVRLSQTGTGYGSNATIFNSATLNLTCSASPITAVLSSSADGTGNIIVDNNINLTVTSGSTTTGPTNVCVGGLNGSPVGPLENCFTAGLQVLGGEGALTGQDPDNFVATGGVQPIDISQSLVPGPVQVKIDLVDQGSGNGFYLSGSTLYLDTNCTQGGVTGPALVSGNPISGSNPTPDQLAQDFSFNPVTNQQIGFTYDLTEAQTASTLTVADGTIPQVGDMPLDPATFQSTYTPQTSFATSICLVHSGELLQNGQPACKVYTLECKVGTGAETNGSLCPISTQSNELFQDAFDGPAFTLTDIVTPNGPTFHEGVGFLMANEGWKGGPCTFDPNANLQTLPCPQNLLTSFASGVTASAAVRKTAAQMAQPTGLNSVRAASQVSLITASATTSYTSSGRTTHPNSTFITVAQIPEDLTTVTVAGQKPGYWINSSTASVTLSSQPPNLTGTSLPGASSFVASPIQSITYGLTAADSVPVPGPALNDPVLSSGVTCPTQANPTGQPATVFTPGAQTFSGLADGYYLLHYYAQDCSGTEELKFTQDTSGNWSTGFYTFPINVDTTAPAVASGPVLSPAPSAQGTYMVGKAVTASYSCTDALSGVVTCGSHSFASGTSSTGTLMTPVDTSLPGTKTYTVVAVDAAGNQSSSSVSYQVVSPYDSQIQFTITPTTVTYGQSAKVTIKINPIVNAAHSAASTTSRADTDRHGPSGTVGIFDGQTKLVTLRLQENGTASYELRGLNAGTHSISVVYSGDTNNPSGTSAPVSFIVRPAPVRLDVDCWNSTLHSGQDYVCGVYADSEDGITKGVITYTYDGDAPKTVPLIFGFTVFTISKPAVGQHTVVVSYAAQTNYAAATPQTEHFTVVAAPAKSR